MKGLIGRLTRSYRLLQTGSRGDSVVAVLLLASVALPFYFAYRELQQQTQAQT